MHLIADGGSTKVNWALMSDSGKIAGYSTPGINPSVNSPEAITSTIADGLLGALPPGTVITRVEYYGAGCRGAACTAMEQILRTLFPSATSVTVDSDITGACKALADGNPAIVCILGTGANSCLYDGERIVDNVPPMGYILGDEGSGAWLGKALVSDIFKGLLPPEVTGEFHQEFPYGYDEMIRRIYRPGNGDLPPNRFLASFAPFLGRHMHVPQIRDIVKTGFTLFFERNVEVYFRRHTNIAPSTPVCFVGSIADAFSPLLRQVADTYGRRVAAIRRSPL